MFSIFEFIFVLLGIAKLDRNIIAKFATPLLALMQACNVSYHCYKLECEKEPGDMKVISFMPL